MEHPHLTTSTAVRALNHPAVIPTAQPALLPQTPSMPARDGEEERKSWRERALNLPDTSEVHAGTLATGVWAWVTDAEPKYWTRARGKASEAIKGTEHNTLLLDN